MRNEVEKPYGLILELLESVPADKKDGMFEISKKEFDILQKNNIRLEDIFPKRKYKITD